MSDVNLMPVSMVIRMLGEGVIDNHYWGTPCKKQANKIRNAANTILNRLELNDQFKTAITTIANSKPEVIYLVEVISK